MEIVEEFMLLNIDSGKAKFQEDEEIVAVENLTSVSSRSKLAVAKLIDAYLAEMVSSSPRPTLDGLYRAIDMFLKEHPSLSKSEKKKLCGLMDCKLLSQDACMHAVQNERLPLRVVVQVLFFEQNRASVASAGGDPSAELPLAVRSLLPRENGSSVGSSRSAATTITEEERGVRTSSDINSLRSMRLANNSGSSERSSGSSDANKNGDDKSTTGKAKGMLMPKKILSKLWSGKTNGNENSSSDTSESPGSVNPEEVQSRVTRHSSMS